MEDYPEWIEGRRVDSEETGLQSYAVRLKHKKLFQEVLQSWRMTIWMSQQNIWEPDDFYLVTCSKKQALA